jgi:hypothetical protein
MATTAGRTSGWPPAVAATVATMLLACAPALDWRDARLEGGSVTMMFPCRPERQERPVRIGAQTLTLQLHSCAAAGSRFALVIGNGADPERVTALLEAWRAQTVANVDGAAVSEPSPPVPGSTPNAQSVRLRIVGRRPDGHPVVEHATFFVKGLTVFEATVIGTGEPVDRDAVDTFFGSIRLP